MTMEKQIADLIEISRFYGRKKDYAIAGGGNTSWKNETDIWVKASGTSLGDIDREGFAVLDRKLLQAIYTRSYSTDPIKREAEVKEDLQRACRMGIQVRPSVETSLHDLINYSFVVHTHPTLVNAITCSIKVREIIHDLFGDDALYIPYTDPGYVLFTCIRDQLNRWRAYHQSDPQLIFLQNHGLFVSANSIEEVKEIYSSLELTIRKRIQHFPDTTEIEAPENLIKIMPALRMIFSSDGLKCARIRNNLLIKHFTASAVNFAQVALPFTPDQIVYCKARAIYLGQDSPEALIEECQQKVEAYRNQFGYMPRMAAIRNYGIIAFEDNIKSVDIMLDVFEDWMKISYLTVNFGGPHFMDERDIEFIDTWEVENYRRQVAKVGKRQGRAEGKIVVVTGGAQGFGSGIAGYMMAEGANVVIADLNETKGKELAGALNRQELKNEAICVQTNVAEPDSVKGLIYETVKNFGGIDVLISNAGILHAGGIEDMSVETFNLITRVNYSAYFLCVKHAAEVMKLQSTLNKEYFTDIIQINSKSGLKGSNRNFAYSGSKFGGIGLTQSFALELIPWRIKVNAICPGNFFEGPLWSDPETGLFVQYLRTGKVPGAKTIAEVKAHYEKQVPAGRGCRVEDVMKAIFYVMEQEYETGQAVPVTGGQEMLR
jgi:NAD(P)-dependent dehydrogenase (short-subunit alcohol dehydrogenase family)/rhamnose utilization protein RhaD (predicted bifunctional aldolase and dehydrogenase)